MNYLLIGVGILIILSIIIGYVKGFIKIAVSIGATIATIALVMFLTPYISDAIIKYTPLKTVIQEAVVNVVVPEQVSTEDIGKATQLVGEDHIEELKEFLATKEITLQQQIQLINQAEIPKFLKQGLMNNNNSEVYKILGVDKFVDYVGAYIVKLIANIVAFIISFIVVTIFIRLLIFSLNIIGALPVFHGFNRVAGAIIGIVPAIIIIWIAFLIITLAYTTELGKICFAYIDQSQILTFIYNNNPILKYLSII
ncbi:MAG: CvpA family protein [Lachnospiraceae bacterium]